MSVEISGKIRRGIMYISFQERRKRALIRYKQEINRLQSMEADELDLEYINTITKYEHKKGIVSIFMISILVATLMNVWKYFFFIIEKIISYLASSNGDTDIAIVTFVFYATIIVLITVIILSMLVVHIRNRNRLNKHLLTIKVVRNKRV